MNLEKYIEKIEYNPDINKTEIWVGNFLATPEYAPIDIISKVILNFQKQNNKIIINDHLENSSEESCTTPLIFENITFKRNIFFENTSFESYINFINCIFEGMVTIRNCIFKKSTNFHNCTFFANNEFRNTTFFSTSVFTGSKFESNNNFSQNHFYEDIFCKNIIVKFSIDFSGTIFEENVDFEGANLEESSTFFYNTKFKNSKKDNIDKKQKKEIDFSRVKFGIVAFSNAVFEKNVRFHEAVFNNDVYFFNTSFKGLVDFYLAKFHKAQQFYLTEFLDRAIFSNTVFHEEAQFLYNRVENNSYINFESTKFKRGLDISRSNFNCNLNFWNITIEINEISNNSKYIDDFGLYTEGTASLMYKRIRETCRIIKSYFYSQNNRIEGLNFYEKEMSVYLEENRSKNDNLENFSFGLNIKNVIKFLANKKKKKFNNNLFEKRCFSNKYLNRVFTVLSILLYLPFCVSVILLSPIYFTALLIHRITNIGIKEALFFFINVIFLIAYIYTKDFIWYIFFVLLFLYILYLIPNFKRSILHSIKENNYISLIIFFICVASILVAAYGAPNQDNYILLWKEKIISFDNDYLTFISYISFIIIAILFATIFKKSEKILLWFNKNSNNFGTNWFIGVNFTTLVALITYVVITLFSSNVTLQLNAEGVGNFLKALVDVLNLTDWNDMTILGKKLNNWQYVTLFIGRIFIAYGIYQTVQAFRKYGKS